MTTKSVYICSMKRANPLWLLPIVCVLLAVFSFVGHGYSSAFMVLLWAALGIWSLVYIVRRKLYKRPTVFLLHLSFMVMLLGAFTTWLLGEQGTLHLRLNETHTAFKLNTGDLRRLPFSITLNNFEVAYIDSSDAPRNYISQVSISSAISDKDNATGTIQMNKPLSDNGYRFYQSSYDQDEQGTHLSVSYDPYGTAITYIGYGLLFLSLFLLLITRVFSIRSKTLSITLLLIFAGIIAATAIPNDFAAASAKHLAAEQLYNTLDAFRIIAYTGIALGLLLLLTPPNSHFLKQKRCLQIIPILLSAYLILMLCLRWYISGYIPLTNGCETMLVMALGISITSIFHDGARK